MQHQRSLIDRREWIDQDVTPVAPDPRWVPEPKPSKGPDVVRILAGGTVFDGTGTPAYLGDVIIRGNRIIQVGGDVDKEQYPEAELLDVSGKTVMPGLIDLHCHLTYPESEISFDEAQSLSHATLRGMERARIWLESGITSIRDAASHGDVPFRLKDWVRQNRLLGPRIFAAGCLITGTGGHAAERSRSSPIAAMVREASGADDWREAVREQFKEGADIIKVASHFSRQEISAAVDEAHSLGLKVMCDAETHYIQWAVEASVDTIEHPLPRTDEVVRMMAENGTAAVPTVVAYIIVFDRHGGYFGSTSRRFTFSKDDNVTMLKRMKDAGVKMGIGTDVIFNDYRMFPAPYITELKMFIEAGFSITEALESATRIGAEILGMADKLGTLEVGKLADVLVVDGKPYRNIDDLAEVDMVMRDGYIVVGEGKVIIPRHTPSPMPDPADRDE